jgi:VanZ family protein
MLRSNIFSVAVALLILVLSLTGSSAFTRLELPNLPGLDKAVHAAMYFTLTLTLVFENRRRLVSLKNYLILSLVPLSFGIIVELLQQSLTKSRAADVMDGVFNLAGIVLAMLVWLLLRRFLPPKRINSSLPK